jgi:hypothetical protein
MKANLYVFVEVVWNFTVAVPGTAQPFFGDGMSGSGKSGFAHESNALPNKSVWMHPRSRSRTSATGGGAAGGTAGFT